METTETEWAETTAQEQEAERQEAGPEEGQPGQLELRPQMLDVMRAMSEYGYLTMTEIQFIYGNKTWSYRHMKVLRKQGVIADFATLMNPRTAHHLTPRGYRVLGKLGRLKTGWRFRPERYSTFSFKHRMACAKVGLLLEKHPLAHDFLPEIRLWKYRPKTTEKVCDGEFWYRVPGREMSDRVGLEVELTLKNQTKLEESFKQLSRRELHQIWWVCGDMTVLKAMRRAVLDRPWLEPQRHLFVLIEDFLAAKGKTELMDAGGLLLSIDPNKPTLLTREPEPPRPEDEPASPSGTAASAALSPGQEPKAQAEAEAATEPEPAPPPTDTPGLMKRGLMRLGAVLLRLLKWTWRWLRESWSVYECYDGSRILTFDRWPHVCVSVVLTAALVIYRHGPAMLEITSPRPTPAPPSAWHNRRLYDYALSKPGWTLYPLSLSSASGRYRFKARIAAEDSLERGLCGAAILDRDGRELTKQTWKQLLLKRGYRVEPDPLFEFRGERSADRFFVALLEGDSRCDKTTQSETFLVQFAGN